MHIKNFANVVLVVLSISSMATAQLMPGPSHPRRPPHPGGPGPHPGPRPMPPMPPPNHGPRPPMPPPHHGPRPQMPPPHHGPRPPMPPPYYPPAPRPPAPPYYPPQPVPPPYNQVKYIYMSRDVINESLDLRWLAGLQNYSGAQVLSVRVNSRSNGYGQVLAQLVLDNRVVASQYDITYQAILYPQSAVVIDRTGRDLRLVISGSIYVDSIEVEIR